MHLELQTIQRQIQTLSNDQLQNLQILQCSGQELERYVREKASENPLLSIQEPNMKELNQLLNMSTYRAAKTKYHSLGSATDFIQETVATGEQAVKPILEQIPLYQNLSPLDTKILKYFIYNLDENYFLDLNFEETAKKFQVTEDYLNHILDLLQTFEPIGVGARNRIEYLLIQIDRDFNAPPLADKFVEYHLDKVASLSFKYLSKYYHISLNKAKEIVQYIRGLNPTVASPISTYEDKNYIFPEVLVERFQNEWIVQIQHPFLPKIEVNEEYVALLQSSEESAEYCKKLLNDALLLKEGITQRDHTLYSITRLLLSIQLDFFEQGINYLKPVRLKDVANALALHESTISRAIRNKYIQTPHGTYAIRSLFVKGLANHSGKMDSVMYIKKRITELVNNEDEKSPLTDQQLTEVLESEGIQISRRTVAKYREELSILSSSKRTQLYKI